MRVKLNDFPKHLQKQLKEAVDHVTSKSYLKEVGTELAEDIKKRTRLGYGVAESLDRQKKFKPLAASTKKARKGMKKRGTLSGDTSPSKSNLTMTGEMVDDLFVETRIGVISLRLKKAFSKKKAKWNKEKGRSFLEVSRSQYNSLVKKLQKDILNKLK